MQLFRAIFLLLLTISTGFAQSFSTNDANPAIERWLYANASTYESPYAPVFAYFGSETEDTRLGQYLVGWDTAALVPTNRGPAQYLIRQCRLTLTINRGNWFAYDPTPDDYRSYFETDHPQYRADTDFGRPVELFGAGFRNGYTAATYEQAAPFGSGAIAQRNAYAVCWSTNGTLVDVSNSVGKTNAAFPRFETWPFAVGQTASVAPGQLVPSGAKLTFELNLADPFIVTYLQRGLNEGRLRFIVATLHAASGQFGNPLYPDFATHFNQAVLDPTRLELVVTAVRDLDANGNGLPDDWEQFYFTNLTQTADADFDGDGASNQTEFLAGTNPTDAASVFRVNSFQHSGGQAELRWLNLPARRFEIDFTADLAAWQTITNPAVRFPAAANAVWGETTNAPARFYRVRAVAD
ncbi:MAG: hypothetical protein QM813_22170 [Verrucomicrobiota bacterium]